MNVPTIPRHLFKFGIKPLTATTEKLYFPATGKGLHLAGFDVETIGTTLFKKNDLYTVQIVADSKEKSHIFFPEKQGIENLDFFFQASNCSTGRIFATAHNASFDIGALLGKDVYELMKQNGLNGWKGKVVDGNSSFAILRNKKENKSLTIADSMSWFKMSLEKFAESHLKEERKLKRPEFLGKRAPEDKEELDIFLAYAEKDALIQFEATKMIYRFCTEGSVKICLTPAQLAGRVFQKHYLESRVFLPYWKHLNLIARTYHGAQFTAFGRGSFKNVWYYDINSLYPFAALNVPLNFSNSELAKLSLEDVENGFTGFVGVKFEFPEKENYPCLPEIRAIKKFPKLIFPNKGLSYCTTEELIPALKKGVQILGFRGVGWYPEHCDLNHPLGVYMNDIYKKKEKLDSKKELDDEQKNKRSYYKLLLNSLIGKFCQRNRNWLTNEETAGSLFKPDFGSLILSRSRAIINGLISKHGAIYSDTDCLLTKHSLPTGTKMGDLKNELGAGKKGDLLSIRSKLYFVTREGNVIKAARHGFRQSSEQVFKSILERRRRTFVRYSVNRLTRLKESYKRNLLPRREINQSFKIMLSDDGKRKYEDSLNTIHELLSDSTFSRPL